MRRAAMLAAVLVCVGAGRPAAVAGPPQIERLVLGSRLVSGLSGMDVDAEGRVLAVAERQGLLVWLKVGEKGLELDGAPVPVRGAPPDLELEALALIAPDLIALGGETQVPERESDPILIARLEGGEATVQETIELQYRPWGLKAGKNHGIEGLCSASGQLLAGSEAVGQDRGKRFAPLGRYDLQTKEWTFFRVFLTTEAGRMASLACRPAEAGGLEVLAIERQFHVLRLLRFRLPAAGAGGVVQPEVLADLAALVKRPPNLEGAGWLPDGRVFLLGDNDKSGPTGPTEAILLRLNEP